MDVKNVRQLINGGENPFVEFSNCTTEIVDSVFQTICSFLNKEGGTLIIGVQDFRKIIGVANLYLEGMLKKLHYTLENEFAPAVSLTPEVVDLDDRTLICLTISPCREVQRFRGKIYDRFGTEVIDVSYSYNLVENIYLRKREESSENIVCPFLRMHDLDESAFRKMRYYISLANPDHPWLDLTDEELLHTAGFWRKDPLSNGKEGFVLAAVLLFGKEATIQNSCPSTHRTDAIYRNISYKKYTQPSSAYPENKYDNRDIIFSNLIDSYLRLIAFVKRNLPDRALELDGKMTDVRKKIFKEVAANMLVHRDYTHKYPSRFLIFSDKVITENGTRPYPNGVMTSDVLEPHAKNPLITKVFQAMNWMGDPGSGMDEIRKYAPLYDRSYEIEVQNGEKFVFSITYGRAEGLTTFEKVDEPEEEEVAVLPEEIQDLSKEWPVYYSKLSEACPGIDISYVEKAESILEACVKPQPIQDMMHMVKQSNRTRFRQNIIRPLLEEGLLAMRIPTKPSSPLQKYFTTEKGKTLL
jgi:ATP-dependent DNA helicase RecG